MAEIQFRAWFIPEKKMYPSAFQKWFHVLLCDKKDGKTIPVRRASYDDCILLENTTLIDKYGHEIFEGDWVKIRFQNQVIEDVVQGVPDMMKSRHLHPLHELFSKHHLPLSPGELDIEVLGDIYTLGKHEEK